MTGDPLSFSLPRKIKAIWRNHIDFMYVLKETVTDILNEILTVNKLVCLYLAHVKKIIISL